jgi:hypothetical protein
MSLSSVRPEFRIFASTGQWMIVPVKAKATPLSIGALYGVFG